MAAALIVACALAFVPLYCVMKMQWETCQDFFAGHAEMEDECTSSVFHYFLRKMYRGLYKLE